MSQRWSPVNGFDDRMTSSENARLVLSPLQILARYHDELHLTTSTGRVVVMPGVIGTVFFERGSRPEVRRGILACFDRFEAMFGEHLKGGQSTDLGKFAKRTAAGVQAIRDAIVNTEPHQQVSVVRSSATDQDTAAEYEIGTLTWQEIAEEYKSPGNACVFPKGSDGGGLSYLKFQLPLDSMVTEEGLAQYQEFLRFVCQTLPVRGGYGGLSSLLPYSFHRFMPQEYELAVRFSGLEIDSLAFSQNFDYGISSYEGPSSERQTAFYAYLKPGAKVGRYGDVKCVNWYTIIGDLFVERLGGEAALSSALQRPDIGIERIGQCLLIRAGHTPRLGAPEEGLPEPYVFVNRVLRVLRNPDPDSLHSHIPDTDHADHADLRATRHWQARFDLPGAPSIPPTPEFVPSPAAASRPPPPGTPDGLHWRPLCVNGIDDGWWP